MSRGAGRPQEGPWATGSDGRSLRSEDRVAATHGRREAARWERRGPASGYW